MKISFNGQLVNIKDSPCTDTGWLIGAGIFETIRTVSGQPYALELHLQRALGSSRAMNVPMPSFVEIRESVGDLLDAQPLSDGMLRISFDARGDWAAVHLPYEPVTKAASVCIHPDALPSQGAAIKSYPYEHRLSILNEAKLLGFDEALVVNTEGNICEGAVSNVIACIDGKWITPPTSDGVLPGIMRDLVLANNGVVVQSLPLARIGDVTSAVLLSSLRIASDVASIQSRPLQPSRAFVDEIRAMARLHSVG